MYKNYLILLGTGFYRTGWSLCVVCAVVAAMTRYLSKKF